MARRHGRMGRSAHSRPVQNPPPRQGGLSRRRSSREWADRPAVTPWLRHSGLFPPASRRLPAGSAVEHRPPLRGCGRSGGASPPRTMGAHGAARVGEGGGRGRGTHGVAARAHSAVAVAWAQMAQVHRRGCMARQRGGMAQWRRRMGRSAMPGTPKNKGGSRSVLWCTRLPNAGPLEPRISDNGSYSHSLHSPRSQ